MARIVEMDPGKKSLLMATKNRAARIKQALKQYREIHKLDTPGIMMQLEISQKVLDEIMDINKCEPATSVHLYLKTGYEEFKPGDEEEKEIFQNMLSGLANNPKAKVNLFLANGIPELVPTSQVELEVWNELTVNMTAEQETSWIRLTDKYEIPDSKQESDPKERKEREQYFYEWMNEWWESVGKAIYGVRDRFRKTFGIPAGTMSSVFNKVKSGHDLKSASLIVALVVATEGKIRPLLSELTPAMEEEVKSWQEKIKMTVDNDARKITATEKPTEISIPELAVKEQVALSAIMAKWWAETGLEQFGSKKQAAQAVSMSGTTLSRIFRSSDLNRLDKMNVLKLMVLTNGAVSHLYQGEINEQDRMKLAELTEAMQDSPDHAEKETRNREPETASVPEQHAITVVDEQVMEQKPMPVSQPSEQDQHEFKEIFRTELKTFYADLGQQFSSLLEQKFAGFQAENRELRKEIQSLKEKDSGENALISYLAEVITGLKQIPLLKEVTNRLLDREAAVFTVLRVFTDWQQSLARIEGTLDNKKLMIEISGQELPDLQVIKLSLQSYLDGLASMRLILNKLDQAKIADKGKILEPLNKELREVREVCNSILGIQPAQFSLETKKLAEVPVPDKTIMKLQKDMIGFIQRIQEITNLPEDSPARESARKALIKPVHEVFRALQHFTKQYPSELTPILKGFDRLLGYQFEK